MRALFDVSMLLALFDPVHVHHRNALTWWAANCAEGWASCPLTQNGFLRIASQPSYANPMPLPQALSTFHAQLAKGGHEFWPDDISIIDREKIDHSRLLGPRQITDICLLALAVRHGGRFVTLDRGISWQAVKGAEASHLVVVE
jgi:toxin-antitoxin system PIN domain toxin